MFPLIREISARDSLLLLGETLHSESKMAPINPVRKEKIPSQVFTGATRIPVMEKAQQQQQQQHLHHHYQMQYKEEKNV